MKIGPRQREDVLILDLDGPLTAGVGDEVLHQEMGTHVAEGWKKILLNLSGVSRIDSTGIGELVASIKRAERQGTSVKLVRIGRKVQHILNLSRILPLLDFYDTEAEALQQFSSHSGRNSQP